MLAELLVEFMEPFEICRGHSHLATAELVGVADQRRARPGERIEDEIAAAGRVAKQPPKQIDGLGRWMVGRALRPVRKEHRALVVAPIPAAAPLTATARTAPTRLVAEQDLLVPV